MDLKIEQVKLARELSTEIMEESLKKTITKCSAVVAEEEALRSGRIAETDSLYKEIEKLQSKINVIEKPYNAKIQVCSDKENGLNKERNTKTVTHYLQLAFGLIEKGIYNKDEATDFLCKLYSDSMHNKKVRIVSHSRGSDFVVIGMTSNWKDNADYIAIDNKKHRIASILHVAKAKHAGDTTYTYSYGCKTTKKLTEKEKVWSREGISMREWLDPILVKWNGVSDEEIVNSINRFDSM